MLLSPRRAGLLVKHTRTGNPLVDSVAEHQPATQAAYYQYLHYSTYPAFAGGALCLLGFSDAKSFLVAYIAVAYYFSAKMMRLILLMGPITSALAGLALGFAADWCVDQALLPIGGVFKWAFPLMLGDAKAEAEEEKEEEKEEKEAEAEAASKRLAQTSESRGFSFVQSAGFVGSAFVASTSASASASAFWLDEDDDDSSGAPYRLALSPLPLDGVFRFSANSRQERAEPSANSVSASLEGFLPRSF